MTYKVDTPDPDSLPRDRITKGDGTNLHPNDLLKSNAKGIKDNLDIKENLKYKTSIFRSLGNTKEHKTQLSRFKKVQEAQQKNTTKYTEAPYKNYTDTRVIV